MNKKNTFRAIQKVAGVAVITAAIGFLGVSCGGGEDSPAPAPATSSFVGYSMGAAFTLDLTGNAAKVEVYAGGQVNTYNGTLVSNEPETETDDGYMELSFENGAMEVAVEYKGQNLTGFNYDKDDENGWVTLYPNNFTAQATGTGLSTVVSLVFNYTPVRLTTGNITAEGSTGVNLDDAVWTGTTTDVWSLGPVKVTQDGTVDVEIKAPGIVADKKTVNVSTGGAAIPTYKVAVGSGAGNTDLTITFTVAVTDVELDVITFSNSAVSKDTNTSFSGSGTTYTVTGLAVDYGTPEADITTTVNVGTYTVANTGDDEVTFLKPAGQQPDATYTATIAGNDESDAVITITFTGDVALEEGDITFDPANAVTYTLGKPAGASDDKVWELTGLTYSASGSGDTIKVIVTKTGVATSGNQTDVELL